MATPGSMEFDMRDRPSFISGNISGQALPTPPDPFAGIDLSALSQQMIPKTGQQVVGEMNAAQSSLPAALQLGAADVSQAAINQARDRYSNDMVRPSIEKMKADLAAEGRDTSTFGAAALAQMQAEGDRQAFYAGEDLIDRSLARWTQKRNSYFGTRGGEGGTVSSDQGGAEFGNFLVGAANARTNASDAFWNRNMSYLNRNDQNQWAGRRAGIGAFQTLAPYATQGVQALWNFGKNAFRNGAPKSSPAAPYQSSQAPFQSSSFHLGGDWEY